MENNRADGYDIKLIYNGKEYPINFIKGKGIVRVDDEYSGYYSASALAYGCSLSVTNVIKQGIPRAYVNGVCIQDYISRLRNGSNDQLNNDSKDNRKKSFFEKLFSL